MAANMRDELENIVEHLADEKPDITHVSWKPKLNLLTSGQNHISKWMLMLQCLPNM